MEWRPLSVILLSPWPTRDLRWNGSATKPWTLVAQNKPFPLSIILLSLHTEKKKGIQTLHCSVQTVLLSPWKTAFIFQCYSSISTAKTTQLPQAFPPNVLFILFSQGSFKRRVIIEPCQGLQSVSERRVLYVDCVWLRLSIWPYESCVVLQSNQAEWNFTISICAFVFHGSQS